MSSFNILGRGKVDRQSDPIMPEVELVIYLSFRGTVAWRQISTALGFHWKSFCLGGELCILQFQHLVILLSL